MYCPHCGNALKEKENFCSRCGKRVEQREEFQKELPEVKETDTLPLPEKEDLGAQKENIESSGRHYEEADGSKPEKGYSENIIKRLLFSKKIEKEAALKKREPLDDGLKKYNYLYILLSVVFLCKGKFLVAVSLGILIGGAIKTVIAGFRWEYLKTVKYCVRKQIPLDDLLESLVPAVSTHGMLVEKKTDAIQIIQGGMQYKIFYEGDHFFKMIPRSPGIQELLQIGIIGKYRRAVTDMGVIGYYITDICSGETKGMTETEVALARNQYAVERRKGRLSTITGIAVGLAAAIVLAFEIGIFNYFEHDYSEEIKGSVIDNTTCTIGDAFNDFFGDLEWETTPSEVRGLYLVDATGKCYYMVEDQLSPITCTVEFVYSKDSGDFYIQCITNQDNTFTDENSIKNFIVDVYGIENIVLPDDLQGMLGALGDAFVSGINGYLFGGYVSFEEGERLLSESRGPPRIEIAGAPATEPENDYYKIEPEESSSKNDYETEAGEYGTDTYNPYEDSVLLWKSFYEPLDETDLAGLSLSDLRIARNEIYAAYGREFTSEDLQDYFWSKSWYGGGIPAESFSDSVLTEVQKNNVALIMEYENSKK